MKSLPFITQSVAPTKGGPTSFSDELLQLQEKMNVALEWLLTNRATMDFCHRELDLNTELAACLNDAQAAKTIKEAKMHCQSVACALQQVHWNNVLALECEAKVVKGQDCQAFAEAFGVTMWACLHESHGALLYPMQIPTGDVPLATILRMSSTAQLWAVTDRGSVPVPPTQSALGTTVPQVGRKCWCHSSDQGVPTLRQDEEEAANIDDMPKEHPCRKQKEGMLAGKALKEAQREAFSKESDMVKVARWAYQKVHWANFEQEGSYNLSSIFCQMATSTNLLGTEVHELWRPWGAKRISGLLTEQHGLLQKTSTSGSSCPQSPKIMGLKGIHSSKALQWWGGLAFFPRCSKEGKNEGTVVKHLQTTHYHLGLICAHCLDYFTTNAETMCCHAHVCKPTAAGASNNDDDKEDD